MKPEIFAELVKSSRSTRRFNPDVKISLETLRELIELAGLTPSSRNRQPLKYILITEAQKRGEVFSCLNWAKALPDWGGPEISERPTAFIVILGDSEIANDYSIDPGIVAQTIMLGARSRGIAGCILQSIDRDRLRKKLRIDTRYNILFNLALGAPAEDIFIEAMPKDGEVKYWRDDQGGHHVPKRSKDELIVGEF